MTHPEGRPFLHEPDEKTISNNSLCWRDQNRMCGPDCVAFGDPNSPEPADRCQVLQIQTANVILLTDLLKRLRRDEITGVPTPPSPFGKSL